MRGKTKSNAGRALRRTVLIVGEGYAEDGLLRHLRSLLTCDRQGAHVTIGNARGHGAGHVVKHAIALARHGEYDEVAVLLDTDHDWTPQVQALAREDGIRVFACTPCLEAWLLRLCGRRVAERINAADAKARFLAHAGGPAHQAGLMAKLLPREALMNAAQQDDILRELVHLIGGQ